MSNQPKRTGLAPDSAATAGTQPEDPTGPGGRPEEFREETAQEAGLAGFGDRADRFVPVHGKVLNRRLDLAEATMEDDRERHVVDDGVVGRSVARVHQTRIFAEGSIPGGGDSGSRRSNGRG